MASEVQPNASGGDGAADVTLVPYVRETWAAWEYRPHGPVHSVRLQKYEDSDGSLKQANVLYSGNSLDSREKVDLGNRDSEPTLALS